MKAEKKNITRVLALAMAIVLVAVLVPAFKTSASAYTSLSHIEAIKSSQTVYTILEIAPAVGTGSLGYYAAGQEPTANWLNDTAQKTSASERKAYADSVFDKLKARGLMNKNTIDTGDEKAKFPLTYTGKYIEYMPWNVTEGTSTTLLKLRAANGDQRTEETTVYGSFTPADKGAFKLNSQATFVDAGTGGYNQNVLYYVSGEHTGESDQTVYYYKPDFQSVTITNDNAASFAGKALYTKTGDTDTYTYAGTVGENDFYIDPDLSYYIVDQTQQYAPKTEYNAESAPYYAVADGTNPYIAKKDSKKGYFDITETDYEYVGDGIGAYSFTAATDGPAHIVKYNAVYVDSKSGYTNNNWLLRYVFDVDEDKLAASTLKIRVDTIVPGAMNADAAGQTTLENLIKTYDMVVLSAGFDYTTGNVPTAKYSADIDTDTLDNDLTTVQAQLIKAAAAAKKPVLLDSRLADETYYTLTGTDAKPELLTLATDLLTEKTAPIVTGSLYCFATDANKTADTADDRSALATKNFTLKFDASLSAGDNSPYSEVRAGIEYENFLRKNADKTTTDLLPTDINMAACIRYIINYSGQLEKNNKTSISVLDVEPQTQKTTGSKCLTKEMVKLWLPENCEIKQDNITITTMSSAEFISHIEDINEQYDLVYIGASLDNFNLDDTNTTTVYNDGDNMNGLIYSNIGDTYEGKSELSGLVSGDTYRFSGNDITKPKAAQLKNFAESGFPVVIADALVSDAKEATKEQNLSITASATATKNNNKKRYTVHLTAEPALTEDGKTVDIQNDLTYIWYDNYGNKIGTSTGTGSIIQNNVKSDELQSRVYHCVATYKGQEVTSNYIQLSNAKVKLACTVNSDGTANLSASVPSETGSVSYTWYKITHINNWYDWYGWDKYDPKVYIDVYSDVEYGKYVCRTTINGNTYDSQIVDFSSYYGSFHYDNNQITCYYDNNDNVGITFSPATTDTWTSVTVGAGTSITIPGQEAKEAGINTETVDKNSVLYKTLSDEFARTNVMSVSQAKADKATLLKYLNLSKPSIELSSKPGSYIGYYSTSLVTDQTLTYTFTINNPTDPTPVTTRYTCALYIDLNADGKYSADEQISDLLVTGDKGAVVAETALAAGKTYTVKRQLPGNYSGIIPWRLMVTQNDTEGRIHASQIDYTYIKPTEATKINILQITDSSNNFKVGENSTYNKLFGSIKDLYSVNFTYITVADLNSRYRTSAAAFEYLKTFDMLIIGFADMYGGSSGFNGNTAPAITMYIDTGKAVLFSHDTTSFCNVEESAQWGYYFNKVIRDPVGLDRYGVTGHSGKSYTTAYKPKSVENKTTEIQGYTAMTLIRYGTRSSVYTCSESLSSKNSMTTTTAVSKVNSGQITTYPFKLVDNMSVAETHEQYYQLNMDSDDTVVWYCLSGGNYTNYFKNDGTNAYYIYNKGNVTYTGAGHTTGSVVESEAELFVNTMIAAYRAAAVDPSIAFKTADSQNVSTQILPVDIDGNTVSAAEDTRVYFKISDTNLVASKTVSAAFYYKDGSGTLPADEAGKAALAEDPVAGGYTLLENMKIYLASTGAEATGNLRSDTLYYIVVPKSVADTGSSAVSLLGVVTTKIGKTGYEAYYRGLSLLTLQKAGYMMLR